MIVALQEACPTWSVRDLCALLEVPRSSYYYEPAATDDLAVRDRIEAIAVEYPRYGYRRITVELRRRGEAVNHKRVLRLMRAANLLVEVRRYVRTTNSRHGYGRYPNLIKHLPISRPDQVWVADITYIRLPQTFAYLAVLMDLFTRSIRGWALDDHMTEALPLAALDRALSDRCPTIHHSDHGVQYAAGGYTDRLVSAGATISMAAIGRPTENAYAERLIRTLKEEEVYLHDYQTLAEARCHIGRFLEEVYQTKRIHSALGYLTPAEFEAALSPTPP